MASTTAAGEDSGTAHEAPNSSSPTSTISNGSRPRLLRRTSSIYYGKISKALFPSAPKPPLKLMQWMQHNAVSKFASRHHEGAVWPIHDLLTTELLLWIFPTHMLTHLIKFVVGLLVLLGGFLTCTIQHQNGSASLVLFLVWSLLAGSIPLWIYWYYHFTLYAMGKPWMDPRLPAVHRMEMHVPLRLFESTQAARRAACLPKMVSRSISSSNAEEDTTATKTSTFTSTPNVLSLDDAEWQFQLMHTVEEALTRVYQDCLDHDDEEENSREGGDNDWSPIKVPGHWMLQGFDDKPIYTNKKYPFPCQPPVVPRQNPTGVYKLNLTLPLDWSNEDDETITILLHGIESACFVFWNGELLGFFKDSRLPSEFVVPSELLRATAGDHHQGVLHLVVARWSDGSYLEDQDHWWMAGIHRSVELIRRRPGADMLDYHVSSPASGDLCVSVQMKMREPSSSSSSRNTTTVTARLYNDEQTTADGGWIAKQEIWSQTQHVSPEAPTTKSSNDDDNIENNNTTTIRFEDCVPNVRQWTAETPHLYTLVLEQRDGDDDSNDGVTTQVESCRVGFRTIDVDGGILHVNGKRITVCGINRHEHDPDHGKVVSLDRMKQDITVLKQNNFNAIRTSHYPAHSSFYRLCDFYGMYVCDEANVETDGMKPMGRLANDWGWENSFVSRVQRMVQRDWNHPSIILWSLGNESGRGRNLVKARKSILDLDTSRPICYEGGGSWAEGVGRTELTDIICPMYPDVSTTLKLAQRDDEDRPIILCEYSHSMNNSNGNLHLYWESFWNPNYPRLQGGFIWDMIDQGLRKRTEKGVEYFGYGGDFGDEINDRQFCINGMFSPEREPHPSVAEIKFLQQPVDITVPGSEHRLSLRLSKNKNPLVSLIEKHAVPPVSLVIGNRYVFVGLSHLSWKWRLICDRSSDPLADGTAVSGKDSNLSLDVSPALKRIWELEKKSNQKPKVAYFLNIEGRIKFDQTWASAGHIVVEKQIPVDISFREEEKPEPVRSVSERLKFGPLRVNSDEDTMWVSNGNADPFVGIDKSTGGIVSLKWTGSNLLCGGGLTPNFTRATTDNDRGGMELVLDFLLLSWTKPIFELFGKKNFSHEMYWNQQGISQEAPPKLLCSKLSVAEEDDDEIKIEAICSVRTQKDRLIFEHMTEYCILRNGRIQICNRLIPSSSIRKIPSLPRVGLAFQLNPVFSSIQYYGRGPHENYPDRKAGSQMGLWRTTPSQMGYDYIVPSENGSRSDCDWISFDSGEGGMLVVADNEEGFSCSALLHSAAEYHHAIHTCDLDVRDNGKHPIHVHVDYKLMGVAGDVSWFPCVYPEYLVKAQEHTYRLWLLPLSKNDDHATIARSVA